MVWLAPKPIETHLLDAWLAAWNERTGDTATAGPGLRIRGRRTDTRYPDFIAMPVMISPALAPSWPMALTCHAMLPDGSEAATVIVYAGHDTLAEHEVKFSIAGAWYDGSAILPGQMLFTVQPLPQSEGGPPTTTET